METLTSETLRRLLGDNVSATDLLQIRLTFDEWNLLEAKIKGQSWPYIRPMALQWLQDHSIMCDTHMILVL